MKNFTRNREALSPVVASIILIAVTVAVSIAAATWMGALTIGQMNTEELKITGVQFTVNEYTHAKEVRISVRNQGSNTAEISEISITDGETSTVAYQVAANDGLVIPLDCDWVLGNSYQIKIMTSYGNVFLYTAVA